VIQSTVSREFRNVLCCRFCDEHHGGHRNLYVEGHFDSACGKNKPALRPACPRAKGMSGSLIGLQFSPIAQEHT